MIVVGHRAVGVHPLADIEAGLARALPEADCVVLPGVGEEAYSVRIDITAEDGQVPFSITSAVQACVFIPLDIWRGET